MSEYWISWYHDPDDGAFEIHSPWWVSGFDMNGRDTVVAAIRADSEDDAMDKVQLSYDNPPEDIDWRFREELTGSPFSDRFPRADWMVW